MPNHFVSTHSLGTAYCCTRYTPGAERGLEQAQIISRTVKDAMHEDRLFFYHVENKIVLNDEVAISQPH